MKKSTDKTDPKKSADVPATAGMLYALREEMMKRFSAAEHVNEARFNQVDAKLKDIEARFTGIEARFTGMEARFTGIDARFTGMTARFNQVDAKLDNMSADIRRIGLLVEEQNAQNKFVLDGYGLLSARLDKIEQHDKDL